jgi:hypothetical protein
MPIIGQKVPKQQPFIRLVFKCIERSACASAKSISIIYKVNKIGGIHQQISSKIKVEKGIFDSLCLCSLKQEL